MKVDPDTVWFPQRLIPILVEQEQTKSLEAWSFDGGFSFWETFGVPIFADVVTWGGGVMSWTVRDWEVWEVTLWMKLPVLEQCHGHAFFLYFDIFEGRKSLFCHSFLNMIDAIMHKLKLCFCKWVKSKSLYWKLELHHVFNHWTNMGSPISTWTRLLLPPGHFCKGYFLPETKIAPENGWLEDAISLWDGLFSRAMLVSGMVINWLLTFSMFLGPSFLLFVGLENKMTQLWPLPSRLGFPSSYSLECKYTTRAYIIFFTIHRWQGIET